MTMNDDVRNLYFDWISDLVCGDRFPESISFKKLLMFLHSVEFRYSIKNDSNRYGDGVDLRWRFFCTEERSCHFSEFERELQGPCSVLEMIVALAIRCEESIMDDPVKGDRTGQWFWEMLASLGLAGMSDEIFDREQASNIINRFLDREYEPTGKGGLFIVRNAKKDLRKVEIWWQLCWYLDNIV